MSGKLDIKENIKGSNVKLLKSVKDQLLKEWDISFGINGEILINILKYLMDINSDIPMKFFKDRIFIHLKSPDAVQYAEIDIHSSDLLDYNANIEGNPNRPDAKNIIKSDLGEYKLVLVDMKGTIDEIEEYAPKNDIVLVRIDTYNYKKIEFHCSANAVIWASFYDPKGSIDTKGLDRLPGVISKVRNDPNAKKAVAIMEPATYSKICGIGGKGKKREIDERIYIQVDKQDGINISSGDRMKGRLFMFSPIDGTGTDQLSGQYEDYKTEPAAEVPVTETGYPDEFPDMGMTDEGLEEVPIDSSSIDSEMNIDRKQKEESRPENKGNSDQLLGLDVDLLQHVYLDKSYIAPFIKLKGLSPITIEVRTDKPVIVEQRPYNSVRALLSVAPRIENEGDTI